MWFVDFIVRFIVRSPASEPGLERAFLSTLIDVPVDSYRFFRGWQASCMHPEPSVALRLMAGCVPASLDPARVPEPLARICVHERRSGTPGTRLFGVEDRNPQEPSPKSSLYGTSRWQRPQPERAAVAAERGKSSGDYRRGEDTPAITAGGKRQLSPVARL